LKLLFTHSYFLRFDQKQFKQRKPYPPLATIQAASLLREKGIQTALFDTNFAHSPKELIHSLEKEKAELLVIYDDGFNYLTKMCLSSMREAAYEMIQIAVEKNIPVFISSSDSTDHYESYLNQGADAVLLGEADQTLLELCEALKNSKSIESIPGIAYKKDSEIRKSTPRKILNQLDKLPLPAWDLIDISPYQNAWKKHGYFSINIATTRGCPFKCNWCAKPIYGNRYNSRSPAHVIEEIKLIRSHFSFDHIWFCDDIFGLKPNWVQEFNSLLHKEKLNISYKIQSRADLLLKDDTIRCLAESGCDEVWIGAESGSQKILDAMDKGTTVEQIRKSSQLMKSHGIKACYFLQFGYPGEYWKDIEATFSLLFENMPHDIGVSVSYPLPGTKFFEQVKNELSGKTNWVDSDELLMMYKGTYSPKFYKMLHRYTHAKFRAKQKFEKISAGRFKSLPFWLYFSSRSALLYLILRILRKNDKIENQIEKTNQQIGVSS